MKPIMKQERSFREARRLIAFISNEYEHGNITEIVPNTIKELMNYLRPLRSSNPTADFLENTCAAAILHYKEKNFTKYVEDIKKIIDSGKSL